MFLTAGGASDLCCCTLEATNETNFTNHPKLFLGTLEEYFDHFWVELLF
jgi:hypothetical protein